MRVQKILQIFGCAAAALFLGVFLLFPVATIVANGCDLHLAAEIFRNRVYLGALCNSTLIACVTTLISAAIALPLALLYDRFRFPGREGCSFLMLLPMILPPFVGALGFQQILGYYGIVNTLLVKLHCTPVDFLGGNGTFWSVCVIEALHLYPIFYLNLVTALANVAAASEGAAANAGAARVGRSS
ncbi:MAG: hypothetical protein MJ016_03675, partial [Victivallaceae bacterium]|nr:hypothetical protein [Victivallaceae bacterium]